MPSIGSVTNINDSCSIKVTSSTNPRHNNPSIRVAVRRVLITMLAMNAVEYIAITIHAMAANPACR